MVILLELLAESPTATPPSETAPAEPLRSELDAVAAEFGVALSAGEMVFALTLWTWLIGAVGQEVFDGFGPQTFTDPDAAFEAQLDRQLRAAGR